jgi:hypothetical protein
MNEETKELVRGLVGDAVREMFKELAPVLQSIALTPEKLREAQKPYEDPAKLARQLHEKQQWQKQEMERSEAEKARQAACTHKDKNQKWAIRLQHNYPDFHPRGMCNNCGIFIHPAYWDYRPITNPDGTITDKAILTKQHPLYHIVQEIESFG